MITLQSTLHDRSLPETSSKQSECHRQKSRSSWEVCFTAVLPAIAFQDAHLMSSVVNKTIGLCDSLGPTTLRGS